MDKNTPLNQAIKINLIQQQNITLNQASLTLILVLNRTLHQATKMIEQ